MAKTDAKAETKEEKGRKAFYLTTSQIEKVRGLAFARNVPESTIVGELIDKAPEPKIKLG